MSVTLLSCGGARLTLPDEGGALVDRRDGGHLVVLPPRDVWERSELAADELTLFGFLVASAGAAMLETLPALAGGCVNYWEAGNWSLHDDAEPRGRKDPRRARHVHLHLLGRSPRAEHPSWRWGEAPVFPAFAGRRAWMAGFERLRPDECRSVAARTAELLVARYRVDPARVVLEPPA